jgi:hypothetical protein
MNQQIDRIGDWPATYQSLYAYLTDWCDHTDREARTEVRRRIAEDAAARRPPSLVAVHRRAA